MSRLTLAMGIDSIEIVFKIEREFKIRLHAESTRDIKRVGDLYDVVVRQLVADGRAIYERDVWDRLCRIVAEVIDIHIDDVRPSADLVHDLGMDG